MKLTTKHLREDQSLRSHGLRGMLRRLVVKVGDASGIWQLLGFTDAYGNRETVKAEAFPGIGYFARPKVGGKPEAIVALVGGEAGHPVVIATRDKSTQVALDDDETAIFNSTGAMVKIQKDGSIVVRAASGKTVTVDDGSGAGPLGTLDDENRLKAAFNAWTPVAGDGGAALKALLTQFFAGTGPFAGQGTWPTGTSVLKAK